MEQNNTNATVALAPPDAGETCTYLSPSAIDGCRQPRSCQSCLMTAGCMINAVGSCVSVQDDPYNPSMDYHLASAQGLVLPNATADGAALSATQMWQFPAGQVKYCNMNDRVCSTCTRANFWRGRSLYPDSRYCVGEDGACVCVDVCERRWFVQPNCSTTGTPTPSYMLGTENLMNNVWQALVGSIVFIGVVLALMIRSKRRANRQTREYAMELSRQEAIRRDRRNQRAAELGVNPLSLSGWEKYRRDLIEKETAVLSSGNETSDASAEEGEETHASATTEETATEAVYVRMPEEEHQTHEEPAADPPSHPTERPSASDDPHPALAPSLTARTMLPQRGTSRLHL